MSIPDHPEFEEHLKRKYKNSFELPQSLVLRHSLDVLGLVDQSSSLNSHFANPTFASVYSWDMDGWEEGIKTGMYYLRRLPKENGMVFNSKKSKDTKDAEKEDCNQSDEKIEDIDVDLYFKQEKSKKSKVPKTPSVICNDEICTSCSC